MPTRFVLGDVVTLGNTFKVAGVATDPSTVALTVTSPAGVATTYTYAAAQIVKDGTGVYSKIVTPDTAGTWTYKWVGTGAAADVEDGSFDIWPATAPTGIVTLEQVRSSLNLGDDHSHDAELELYIAAVTEHVESRVGQLPSGQYTETATVVNGRLLTRHWPVLTVVSAVNDSGTAYSTGFTVGDGAFDFEHDSLTYGEWTVTYTAGYATIPADLRLAALEDIRGLFQPGQFGPPSVFGAFGATEPPTGFRPVGLWPRVDAWVAARYGPVLA